MDFVSFNVCLKPWIKTFYLFIYLFIYFTFSEKKNKTLRPYFQTAQTARSPIFSSGLNQMLSKLQELVKNTTN